MENFPPCSLCNCVTILAFSFFPNATRLTCTGKNVWRCFTVCRDPLAARGERGRCGQRYNDGCETCHALRYGFAKKNRLSPPHDSLSVVFCWRAVKNVFVLGFFNDLMTLCLPSIQFVSFSQ